MKRFRGLPVFTWQEEHCVGTGRFLTRSKGKHSDESLMISRRTLRKCPLDRPRHEPWAHYHSWQRRNSTLAHFMKGGHNRGVRQRRPIGLEARWAADGFPGTPEMPAVKSAPQLSRLPGGHDERSRFL
jgi:hypothetical protein